MIDDASILIRALLAPIELMWRCFELVSPSMADDAQARPVRTVFRCLVVLVVMIVVSVVAGIGLLWLTLLGWVSALVAVVGAAALGLLAGFGAIWWMSRP